MQRHMKQLFDSYIATERAQEEKKENRCVRECQSLIALCFLSEVMNQELVIWLEEYRAAPAWRAFRIIYTEI